jgi:tetratricopeptide (TPR) repeat protein
MKSPQLFAYLKKYQEDPTSRVFAPLAEAYRKAGLVEEAIEIAREGLRVHPGFIGGRVALARALFDKARYEEVVVELGPVVDEAPDNLIAQRLFADSTLLIGRDADALGSYKMLLYFNPGDADTAKLVQELEARAYDDGSMVLRTDPVEERDIEDFKVVELNPIELRDEDEGSHILDLKLDEESATSKGQILDKVEKLQTFLQRVERYRVLNTQN